MTKNEASLVLYVLAFSLLLSGAGEAGAFVGVAAVLVALLAPDEAHVDARQRNPNQATRRVR